METYLEHPITKTVDYETTVHEFVAIINTIANSNYGEQLKEFMKTLIIPSFKYGFGANHMWLKQLDSSGNLFPNRILIVFFED